MELNEIKNMLEDRNIRVVAKRTGVGYFALRRWLRGETLNPGYEMVRALEKYLTEPWVA